MSSRDALEAWALPAIHHHLLEEHGVRPHPPTRLVVERAVDDQGLVRFAVTGDTDQLVFAALVVPVAAQGRIGQGRQIVLACWGQ
jgi:hypothetical protein